MQDLIGYQVTATEAPISHRGVITVFYCEAGHLSLEALRLHGPNIIIFHLVTGQQRWHVIGCYIAPEDASTI